MLKLSVKNPLLICDMKNIYNIQLYWRLEYLSLILYIVEQIKIK